MRKVFVLPAAALVALAGIAAAVLLGSNSAPSGAMSTISVAPLADTGQVKVYAEHAAVAATGSIQLTITSDNAGSFTVAWTPPGGIIGYVFTVDGARVSNTWNAGLSTAKFRKLPAPPSHVYAVVPVVAGVAGAVTYPQPRRRRPRRLRRRPRLRRSHRRGCRRRGISMPLGNITGKSSSDQDWMLDQIVTLGHGHPMFLRTDWWPGNAGFQALAPKIAARPSIVLMPILNYNASGRPSQAAFATQAGQLAQLGYRYIDLLNEPDMTSWSPQDAASYFTAGKAAIKAVNPNAVVIGPSIWKTTSQNPADGFNWFKGFVAAGGRPDVFDIHLYNSVTCDRSWNNWAWLPDYRALLNANGMSNVPIITSEAGDRPIRRHRSSGLHRPVDHVVPCLFAARRRLAGRLRPARWQPHSASGLPDVREQRSLRRNRMALALSTSKPIPLPERWWLLPRFRGDQPAEQTPKPTEPSTAKIMRERLSFTEAAAHREQLAA